MEQLGIQWSSVEYGQSCRICAETFQNHVQIGPKSFQNPPKIPPNGAKIDPEGLLEPIWYESFNKVCFESPKNAQEAPKSTQERPQPVPKPSQMEAKTLPEWIFELFFGLRFPVLDLLCFIMEFLSIFGKMS